MFWLLLVAPAGAQIMGLDIIMLLSSVGEGPGTPWTTLVTGLLDTAPTISHSDIKNAWRYFSRVTDANVLAYWTDSANLRSMTATSDDIGSFTLHR